MCSGGHSTADLFLTFRSKTPGESQDRQRRDADEEHAEFHAEARNGERLIGFDCVERVAHHLFDGDISELRAAGWLPALARCGVAEFGVNWTRTKRGDCHAG